MLNKKILIPLLLILFMASMAAFGAPVYVNVGPTTEFDGDIKILSEIVAEGTTVDGWETTVFFTDPTADRTITIPDFDVTVGTAILLTVTDNENTNENNAILFTSGGVEAGILNIESDGGDFYYNPSDGSLHAILFYGDGSNLTNVGAATATALTIDAKVNEAGGITKGQPVYFSGAVGQLPQASLADNTIDGKTCVAGIAAETKTDGQTILIRVGGQLDNLDTSAYSDGDCLYLSTAGSYSTTIPTSGAIIIVAGVEYDHASLGKLLLLINRTKDKGAPSGTDLIVRMGDNAAANKVIFKDYANVEVAFIDSDGKADFTSLTLDTALLIAEGGTNSAAAITNDRVMVSSGGAIIHSATITVTELGLLNGIISVSTGVGDNDKFVTQGYVDDIVGGANTALSNLAAVQINTSLLSDAADTDSLGTATAEWLNLYIGDLGKIYCGLAQDISIHRSGAGIMTLTAANGVVTSAALTVTGALGIGANNLTLTGYVGRDANNFLGFDVDNTLKIEINNVLHSIISISDGAANNDKLCTQGYADDAAAGGGANLSLSNLAAVAINLSLVSDAADTDDLGSATKEWLNLYLGTYGTVYFGTGQTENIAETALNELTITATTVAISGTLAMGANNITTTGYIGRDADNYLSWDTDNALKIEINNVLHSIVSITDGVANNDKLATQGYVDDQVAGANVNLSNLAAIAINTSLLSDAADTDDLGSVTKEWRSLYIGEAGKIYLRLDQSVNLQATGAGILTITAANGIVTSNALTVGGTLALAANSITMTGSIGVTGSRVTKIWTVNLESTNVPTVGGTALPLKSDKLSVFAATTSAELAGVISDETGTLKVVLSDSPVFTTQITTPKVLFDDGQGIYALDGHEQLLFGETASAVNYLKLTNSATTNAVILEATGSDANVFLRIKTKGVSALDLHTEVGGNPTFWLSDADCTHPFTAIGFAPEINTNVVGFSTPAGATTGGFALNGFSDSDQQSAFMLVGYIGSTTPATSAVRIYGWKSNGTTGRAAMTTTEKLFSVYAGANEMYYFTAAGTAYADVAWSTFSPKIIATGKDLLAVALEDANKPVKPYEGVPNVVKDGNLFDDRGEPYERKPNEFRTQAEVDAEIGKYAKSPAKIAIASARYLEYLTGIIDTMQMKIDELEVRITQLEKK